MSQANGNTTTTSDPVTGPLGIVLGIPDSELSTRRLAGLIHVSQPTMARRMQQAREAWDRTHRREFWRTVMYVLLTGSAVMTAISLAVIAAG